jgi:hypothetical protein
MATNKHSKESLAALIIAAGLVATSAVEAAESGGTDSLYAIDRTSTLIAHGGKASACGKCASQGQCGISYHEKLRQRHKHTQKRVHIKKESSRTRKSR